MMQRGAYKTIEIPIGDLLNGWEIDVSSEEHNVKMTKTRNKNGADILSSDVKISQISDNILEDVAHGLYVKGTADNIKYDRNKTVADEFADVLGAINSLNATDTALSAAIDANSAEIAEQREIVDGVRQDVDEVQSDIETINKRIGSGFSGNMHDNITDAFEFEIRDRAEKEQALSNRIDDVNTAIEGESVARAQEDTRINNKLDELENESYFEVASTPTVVMTKKPAAKGYQVKSAVKRSAEEGNIILERADGLFASVGLSYDGSANKLTFTTNGNATEISLLSNSIIDKIYYDPIAEEIVIEYTVNGQRMEDVRVPVRGLIDEWTVSPSTSGAIRLTKQVVGSGTTGSDVLSAEVLVSTVHNDNILINDNGALYVSGAQIEANKEAAAEISDKVTALSAEVQSNADDAYYIVKSTRAIKMTKAEEAKGTSIEADLNLSATAGNILKIENDGVYSTVDLTYDANTNKLTFKTTNGQRDISLVSNSVVDKIYYDHAQEAIIIEYSVNGHRMPDVVIPVRELINEIDVADTTTINLVKTPNPSTRS